MKKIHPYKIYHLNHERLRALQLFLRESELAVTATEKLGAENYTSLLSNLPRHDKSLRLEFKTRFESQDAVIDDLMRDMVVVNRDKLLRKIASSKKLLEAGYYYQVAEVMADCAKDAIELTTSFNRQWMLTDNKKVNVCPGARRSTETYDIIKRFGEPFLNMPLGFVDMGRGAYAEELV